MSVCSWCYNEVARDYLMVVRWPVPGQRRVDSVGTGEGRGEKSR